MDCLVTGGVDLDTRGWRGTAEPGLDDVKIAKRLKSVDEGGDKPVFEIRSREGSRHMQARRWGDNGGYTTVNICATLGRDRGRDDTCGERRETYCKRKRT